MKSLQDLKIFNRTAELGSLSACARALELTPAACSAALKRLEAELGAALFVRSTRHLRLTQQGEQFLGVVQQALLLLETGYEQLHSGRSLIRGTLQLSLPSDLGRNRVLGWLDEFMEQHPQIELRVQLSDRLADIYRQPVDLALRYGLPPDSSLIALPVARDNRRVLCAAPAYLAAHGRPRHPEELAGHNCLCFMLGEQSHNRWRFFREGRELSVAVRGNRMGDDGDAVRRWALAGHGIAYKSALDIGEELHEGRLVPLCPEWLGEPSPLNLLCADRRQLNPAVQALHTFLADRCRRDTNAVAG